MADEKTFAEVFGDYHQRIVLGGPAEVKKIVGEVRSSWITDFHRLDQPNPLLLKQNPELATDEEREVVIENALTVARTALHEAATDDHYTLEGAFTWEMEAVLSAGLTAKDITQDADVLVFLTRFLDRAYLKRDWSVVGGLLSSSQRLPQATRAIVAELAKRDPLKVIADQIKGTWEISEEKYPSYKDPHLSDIGRITSHKATPKTIP